MSHKRAKEILDKAEIELNKCLKQVNDGEMVNVDDFDVSIREFCEVVTSMPREDAEFYKDSLMTLKEALDYMSDFLTKRKDEIGESMNSLASQKVAQTAYKKGNFEKSDK